MRKFLASVGNAKLLGKVGGQYQHIADIRTLTESTLNFANTMEEIRAGQGAQLYGRFAHDSGMTVTLTDAMFDIRYVAMQVGANLDGKDQGVEASGLYLEPQPLKVTGGKINLTKTPSKLGTACGLDKYVVWVREKGCEASGEWKAFVLPEQSTEVTVTGFADNTDLCVEYFVNRPGQNAIQVKSNFIPAELILILTTKLFAGDANAPETGKPVGEITVKIPRFQLDGTFDLSMAMSAASTMSLQGTALAVDDGTCEGGGVYAEIVEIMDGQGVLTGLNDVLIDGESEVVGATPKVYGLYGNTVSEIYADNYVARPTSLLVEGKFVEGKGYIIVCENPTLIPGGNPEASGLLYDTNGNAIGYAEPVSIESSAE